MKTEINRTFNWGFVLSETDLRRVAQACQEHFSKLSTASPTIRLLAKLKDGSVLETQDVDDILALENSGSKGVRSIEIRFNDGAPDPAYQIEVIFQNVSSIPRSWTSINLNIKGDDRDWVFLAAADLEERLKKTKTIAFDYFVNHRLFSYIPFLFGLVLFMFLMTVVLNEEEAILGVEELYKAGELSDPIEALIMLEKAKVEVRGAFPAYLVIGVVGGPIAIALVIYWLFPRLFPSYNFYWGDYVSVLDRRRGLVRIVWVTLGLGVLATIIGGVILGVLNA
ncbi:MAG: hypothetical protein IIA89_14710 [Chloroflexi bacterium]|nr:hypothetical protein [Chloroflexota bacterium]